MRAALYARVSTEEQAKNFSIETQLDQLHRYCQQHGYEVAEEYIDPGFSGTTLQRPALSKLLKDAQVKRFDCVVVYKLDRLFRSNRHMYNTIFEWEELGIALASVTEPFDTTTTMGKAYLGMASTFAEWERNTFIERSRDGMRKAIEKGQYSGGIVAYGYRLNPDTKQLEIDEQEAKVVRDMFSWLINDKMSCYTIAQMLNALVIPTRYAKGKRGIRSKKTASVWRPSRVYHILTNTMYTGKWQYGRRGKRKELIPARCPDVIDDVTFEMAQARLRKNNLWADKNRRRTYLLRGLIRCDLCGHYYTGFCTHSSAGRELRYYRCNGKAQRGNLLSQSCRAPSISADVVEELIWSQISEFVQNPEVVKQALEDKFDASRQAGYIADLARTRHRLGELKQAEINLLKRFADPADDYSLETLEGALVSLRRDRELVQRKIRELEETITAEDEQQRKLEDVTSILSSLKESVENATPQVKLQVIETLLQEIRVGKSEDGAATLKIVYAFTKPAEYDELFSTRRKV